MNVQSKSFSTNSMQLTALRAATNAERWGVRMNGITVLYIILAILIMLFCSSVWVLITNGKYINPSLRSPLKVAYILISIPCFVFGAISTGLFIQGFTEGLISGLSEFLSAGANMLYGIVLSGYGIALLTLGFVLYKASRKLSKQEIS